MPRSDSQGDARDGRPHGLRIIQNDLQGAGAGGQDFLAPTAEFPDGGDGCVAAGKLLFPELELLKERREFAFLEEGHQGLPVGIAATGGGEIEGDVLVRPDSRQLPAQPDLVGMLAQRLLGPGVFHPVDIGEEVLYGAEFLDQAESPLGTDPRRSGDVVRGVAGETHDLHDLGRGDAEFLPYRRRVVDLVLHRVHEEDGIAHELHHILVPGDDIDLEVRAGISGGQGADDVVGLHPLLLQDGDGKAAHHLPDAGQLGDQVRRDLPARGLVTVIGLVAESRPLDVEGHGEVVRLPFLEEADEHGGEPVNGVGGKATGVGQAGDGVKSPKDVVVPVDEKQRRSGSVRRICLFCHPVLNLIFLPHAGRVFPVGRLAAAGVTRRSGRRS